jgi:Sodium Bile acid symporter family
MQSNLLAHHLGVLKRASTPPSTSRCGRLPSRSSSSSAYRCRPAISPVGSERSQGREWYETRCLTKIGPWALNGLLFTIVILSALQGAQIISRPWDVARNALPLLAYFAIVWGGGHLLGSAIGLGYKRATTPAFTAAGNNFELAIAVAATRSTYIPLAPNQGRQ